MANKKIYEVEVTGTEKAASSIRAFEDTLAKGGAEAAGKFGAAFKGLSRDIDVIGGEMTAKVTKGVSDFLGVVEAIGSGGILGPIALVSAAIGGVVQLVGAWREEEEQLAKAIKDAQAAEVAAAKAVQSEVDAAVAAVRERRKEATIADLEDLQAAAAARGEIEARLESALADIELRVRQRSEITAQGRQRNQEDIAAGEVLLKQLEDSRSASRTLALQTEQAQEKVNAAERREIDRKEDDLRRDLDQKRLERRKLQAKEGADYEIAFRKSIADYEALAMEDEAAREKALSDQREAEYQAERARLEGLVPLDADRDIEAEYKMEQARLKAIEDEKNLRNAIYERGLAQIGTSATTIGLEGATMAMGMTSMVVNAMMQPLVNTLQAYGSINRENWRDLLSFNEDFRNSMAAQVQIALWSLAQQAASKSVFEAGESVREQASAFGALATGNFVGASMHQVSAIQHNVARDLYAGIAGVSAGASLGVGATRGEGGLFGLTKEERDRKNRENGTGQTSGGPESGSPRSRGSSGSDGPQVVNMIYNNMAGAIDARSRDAAAATTARSFREARRSGYTNRMLRA